jgi:hypothetical protein
MLRYSPRYRNVLLKNFIFLDFAVFFRTIDGLLRYRWVWCPKITDSQMYVLSEKKTRFINESLANSHFNQIFILLAIYPNLINIKCSNLEDIFSIKK